MSLNDVLRVRWRRSRGKYAMYRRADFTLTHGLWDGRTLCGLEIPVGAEYEATTKGPMCSRCMNAIAREEEEPPCSCLDTIAMPFIHLPECPLAKTEESDA